MTSLSTSKYGVFAIHDSGVPIGSKEDYTTLVILHGFTWHAGVFTRLLPLSHQFNTRIVLVNRRDYPGSKPFDHEELRPISSIDAIGADALSVLNTYMKERARELYDFLELFVQKEKIPKDGRLIVAGWSFGANWITALLANAQELSVNRIPLSAYIRWLILYDPPYHSLGYAPPETFYNPLAELSESPEEVFEKFQAYVSGYYSHGELPHGLELRNPAPQPRPTFETMLPEEIESSMYPSPAFPGRSDTLLLEAGIQHGLFRELKDAVLYRQTRTALSDDVLGAWDNVKVRYVWCDHSSWEVPWGAWSMQTELEAAKILGKPVRQIEFVRVEGANHFAHWDQPERALRAFLDDNIQRLPVTMDQLK
ncbi:hypothetical protein A7U60_g7771 [Sanghuangporus baumii]|uniref:AB hydrolase-1 domain-containing protein n=1 Tax=Sanghuangporus baumii TaxID=108892 RepID=A0A9Q5HSL0_SANBA|nr:hypothetical protein A7U60_g7771 [Sanghuangporus baumii]